MNKFKSRICCCLVLVLSVTVLCISLKLYNDRRAEQQAINNESDQQSLNISEMKAIAKLATLDCTYHNVADYNDNNKDKWLWFWDKYKHFWIEYDSTVKVTFDVDKMKIDVTDNSVKIYIPYPNVETDLIESSVTKDKIYIEKTMAQITVSDQLRAVRQAQDELKEIVLSDETVIDSAYQQFKFLISNYVDKVGQWTGTNYKIEWFCLDSKGNVTK